MNKLLAANESPFLLFAIIAEVVFYELVKGKGELCILKYLIQQRETY